MFWRNVLPPSLGWLKYIQMVAEVTERKSCVGYVEWFEHVLSVMATEVMKRG
jgi:hypothetical protein